jgi:hypothetical protein
MSAEALSEALGLKGYEVEGTWQNDGTLYVQVTGLAGLGPHFRHRLLHDRQMTRYGELSLREPSRASREMALYFTRAKMRCTTDVLVRRSPSLSTRTDKDVRPTKASFLLA